MPNTVKIIQKDHPTLRKKAKAVAKSEFSSSKLNGILEDMREALASQNDGVALAAPQINISKRIFIISPKVLREEGISKNTPLVYINPEISKISRDKKKVDEGCLSVRPWYGKVKRPSRVTINALNEKGEKFEVLGKSLLAQIFQHEYDHLEGILFTDHATDLIELDLENE